MVQIRVEGDAVVLVGEIDIAARDLVPIVVAELGAGDRLVTIDLSAVTFIDGAGLDALVRIAEAAVAGGATVRYGTSRPVTRYLELTDTALPA